MLNMKRQGRCGGRSETVLVRGERLLNGGVGLPSPDVAALRDCLVVENLEAATVLIELGAEDVTGS